MRRSNDVSLAAFLAIGIFSSSRILFGKPVLPVHLGRCYRPVRSVVPARMSGHQRRHHVKSLPKPINTAIIPFPTSSFRAIQVTVSPLVSGGHSSELSFNSTRGAHRRELVVGGSTETVEVTGAIRPSDRQRRHRACDR